VTSGSRPVDGLRQALVEAAAALRDGDGELPAPTLERPPRAEFGDYSSNVAMLLAPALRSAPREIAERVGGELRTSIGSVLERVEVAGPGFVNLFLSDSWFCSAVQAIREEGDRFGGGVVAGEQRELILVEFVSANPTGPMTVASGRHAAFGDSLARTLAFAGHQVEREYYVNDYGTQVELFGRSIAAAMKGEEPPEDGYRGDYIADLARLSRDEGHDPSDIAAVSRRGVELIVEQVRSTLERFRVRFDRWFSEHELQEQDRVQAGIELLEQAGHVYSSEGATWLRTTSFGDDKDRVLRRSSGELTYFGTDIAYHENKLGRDYDRLINVLGADHHGYVHRIKAAYEALGGDRDRLEVIIMQLVNVLERGERAQMSKRRGEFVTLDELIDDIGVDAARFFMLQRSSDTTLDVDLDLAREQSQENPVYYVQYAHARIASILRNAGDEVMSRAQQAGLADLALQLEPAERALVKRLLEFPEEIRESAERRAPHRLATYAHELASDFHAFYRDCHVVGAEPAELEQLRVCICVATRDVIARSLDLLGVESPEQM
jgi:arginyl-tRNA synthetase